MATCRVVPSPRHSPPGLLTGHGSCSIEPHPRASEASSSSRSPARRCTCATELCKGGIRDEAPAWSPDGTLIAFSRERNIFVIGPDGRELTRLTDCPPSRRPNDCESSSPTWSPDGSNIAFNRPDGVYVMNANGKDIRRIGPQGARAPAWQPQGVSPA